MSTAEEDMAEIYSLLKTNFKEIDLLIKKDNILTKKKNFLINGLKEIDEKFIFWMIKKIKPSLSEKILFIFLILLIILTLGSFYILNNKCLFVKKIFLTKRHLLFNI